MVSRTTNDVVEARPRAPSSSELLATPPGDLNLNAPQAPRLAALTEARLIYVQHGIKDQIFVVLGQLHKRAAWSYRHREGRHCLLVTADIDTLLTALYVFVDDHLMPRGRRRVGRPRQLSDAELVCLLIAQVLLEYGTAPSSVDSRG
jgi:hypothetical protein